MVIKPYCHFHAHGKCLFTRSTRTFKTSVQIKSNSRQEPKSSKIVNNGKNIAIGGNITETTQVTV